MLAAALSLGLVACDGPKENAMEDAGEQTDEVVNEQADAMEDAGQISDAQADAMTDQAEAPEPTPRKMPPTRSRQRHRANLNASLDEHRSGPGAIRGRFVCASDRRGPAAPPAAQQVFLRAAIEHIVDIDHRAVGVGERRATGCL